ncbi:MAG TPA: urease subunit beta [Acidimicrobiales bacterium]|nr:urease subunit beta [Acidimicrobiales bacterium]
MIPGEVVLGDSPVTLMTGRPITKVAVENTGDRPVQVGSHFHFAEVNPALQFDRAVAMGKKLAIAAGTSVRFEPGIQIEVELVDFAGARFMAGFRGEVRGAVA